MDKNTDIEKVVRYGSYGALLGMGALGIFVSAGANYFSRELTKPSASLEATLQDADSDGTQETILRTHYSCYVLTYDIQGQPHASYCPDTK